MPMPIRQFEPRRAVEIIAPSYGSGYRLGGSLVLTAAHLLGEKGSDCEIRDKRSFGKLTAKVVWKAEGLDIALIEYLSEGIAGVEPVTLGRLPEDKTGEKLDFQMYGYPLWAQTRREQGSVAGGRQIEGTIYLSDFSSDGLLVLEAERLPPEATTATSEWAGASGAAIVCDGLVIAVQSQHQNPSRPASLEASPVWIVYADEQWQKLLEKHGIHPDLEIARVRDGYQFGNTTQLTPGFDIEKYRKSLQISYGFLKLSVLSIQDPLGVVRLWSMFIEPSVREGLPPLRFDLPLEVKRQLQQQGRLENDLSSEMLEHYHRQYFQQPLQKVLVALDTSQLAVILGYPGAGKSTLLQYIALNWAEGKTEKLPLLIELREYVSDQSANFLEFLHCGQGADWQFDQKQLHQHLQSYPTLVMFDGLDEVFDLPRQSSVTDEIIRFTQEYPKVRVLITSRIIGYNPDRFKHAGFHHFTIQPLNQQEIDEFINRWYILTFSNYSNGRNLAYRLSQAIARSAPLQDLAENPLLLTMMAILNQEKELPSDRLNLYDQASQVLLRRWDVDHKRLKLPINTIGLIEKKEILCLVAYEMQASEQGLRTNLISAKRLIQVVTKYLRDELFYSEPHEKATQLIEQLRERNFILCFRGADTYGFVHRTFLEYFCAVQAVSQLGQEKVLTFERLRDEVFEPHFRDKTWHEVLRLVASMIDVKLAEAIVEYLMDHKYPQGNLNKFLAAKCVADIGRESEFGYKYGLQLMNFWEDFTI
jgi:hypothetical protein